MSSMDIFVKFVLDKLYYIRHAKDFEEMNKRLEQSIYFFRSCLKNQEVIIAPTDLKKIKEGSE